MMKTIRMGVIGIGNMGSEHCRNLMAGKCPEIELTAAADPRADRRAWAKETLPAEARVYESGEELIRRDDCDAVLIAVPHPLHAPLSLQAMAAGKHVLCEKPIAVSVRDARRMLAASRETGKTLALMFNQRTNCLYRSVREELSSGRLGEIKRVVWIVTDWYRTQQYYDSGRWRATWRGEGGGVLLNQCPHQLDLLIWLCGQPRKVSAVCSEGKWHHIEVEDDVSAFLEFENGATGVFITSTGDCPGTNRLEIDCTKGKLVCENGRALCQRIPTDEREICFHSGNPWYIPEISESYLPLDGSNEQHVGVLKAFAAHLLRGEPLVANAADGLKALELSNAIHLSGWTGRPVSLPLDEEAHQEQLDRKIASSRLKTGSEFTYQTSHQETGALC